MNELKDQLRPLHAALLLAVPVLLLLAFREGIAHMVSQWAAPEYTHGYIIPFLAAYLFLIRAETLAETPRKGSWAGAVIVGIGLFGLLVGELSAIYAIVQYSFLLTVGGIAVTMFGVPGAQAIWASLLFLIFMIPLPYFIQFNLSAELQMISTDLGAGVLRLLGLPVYVEGNVIDMGVSKLQVVEACSGLRYLFPLMSLGFICGYLFKGPVWQRWLIFLSTVPITIVMNSVRIAITGILYDRYGIGAGDDFLHYFEGWVIFIACMAILFGEMALLAALRRKRLDDALDIELPSWSSLRGLGSSFRVGAPTVAAAVMLALGLVVSYALAGRVETIPQHERLSLFPLSIGDWRGREGQLSADELDVLKLTDYTIINYRRPADLPVELYIAYYDSQRKGASVHSPRACLPSGGWRVGEFDQVAIPDVQVDGGSLAVNRALITMGENRMLVYYWFTQRGRNLTNEYLVKWYIFWDSITKQRTDGALVRLVTPVADAASVDEADQRLAEFVRKLEPKLDYHIPQEIIVAGQPHE